MAISKPEAFNPLEKRRLAESVANALLERPCDPLPPRDPFDGAGIYAIYYVGDFEPYGAVAKHNRGAKCGLPIYVGKAVPPGARKGGFGLAAAPGDVLHRRLLEHAESIQQAENLNLAHFRCRCLVTEDIWIPLGEQLLIEWFSPIWNKLIEGFGIHDPGRGRYRQRRSAWDTLHPGRPFAARLRPNPKSAAQILKELRAFSKKRLGELKKT
jgi:hypothetical protein